jgi:ribosome-binding protein aMBF1 (putative translation factor)
MRECFRCGASEDKVKIYHAISNRGIVKICEDCNRIEQLPIMNKPTDEQILQSKSPRSKSIQDRLNAMRGKDINKNKIMGGEVTLRQLIDKKFQSQKPQVPSDLIPNFHWEIQRAKRVKKITREEFAKGIGESDAVVRMIEQGILPNNDYRIINKIEGFLGISLRKQANSGFSERKYLLDNSLIAREEKEMPAKKLSFDVNTTKELKISDVKKMKEKYESEIPAYVKKENKKEEPKKEPVDSWEEEYAEDDEKYLDTQEEFDEDDEDKD